jgi:hypothetical protein
MHTPTPPPASPATLRLMLAIQRAQAGGFAHLAAALARLLRAELAR